MIAFPLKPGDVVDGKYTINFVQSSSPLFHSYRVKTATGIAMLKLCVDPDRDVSTMMEAMRSGQAAHNMCGYVSEGSATIDGRGYPYVVTEFISHETPRQRVERKGPFTPDEALSSTLAVLKALRFLHDELHIAHLNVGLDNVLLPLTEGLECTRLAGLEHCRKLASRDADSALPEAAGQERHPADDFKRSVVGRVLQADSSVMLLAPECFTGRYDERSDVYMVGHLLYYLLTGIDLCAFDLAIINPEDRLRLAVAAKRRAARLSVLAQATGPQTRPASDGAALLLDVAERCMKVDPDERPETIGSLFDELAGIRQKASEQKPANTNIRQGEGMKDVAGMKELKDEVLYDVIEVMQRPEDARELGLNLPNGILLYGPPGCGKTFFAEKLAEEMRCHYMYIHCSDVASHYIHGGQEKIAAIFAEARAKAPTLLFLDELDAMVCSRDKHNNVSESGEVNEFLAQMNNIGEQNVLVIGATNRPKEIDEAMTRAGRMELRYYIGPPDEMTLAELFRIHLRRRRTDGQIDFPRLANLTKGRVSADVKLIIDTAARAAFRQHAAITQQMLVDAVGSTQPTVSKEVLEQHEKLRQAFESKDHQAPRRPIGFNVR